MNQLLTLFAVLDVLLLLAAPAGAQLDRSFSGARSAAAALGAAGVPESVAVPAVPEAVDVKPGGAAMQGSDALAPVDPKAEQWLASRIPGLDTKILVAAPFEVVDAWVTGLADAKKDYLDLLSDPILNAAQGPLYYLSREVLERLDAKYVAGTLPVDGTSTKGKPFRMEAMVAGMGATHYVYDQTEEFGFKNGKFEFKMTDGHVVNKIEGPADVSIQGLKGCGCIAFFCGCADIQRIRKIEPGKVTVLTTRGTQDSNILPITRK